MDGLTKKFLNVDTKQSAKSSRRVLLLEFLEIKNANGFESAQLSI